MFKQSEQKTETIPSRNIFRKQKSAPSPKKKKTPSNLIFHSTESKSYKAITFCIYSREKSRQNKMQNKKKAISKKKNFQKVFNYHIENMEIRTLYLMKANDT